MNSLGLVAITPPDKTMTSENGGHNSSNFSLSVNTSFSSNFVSNRQSFSNLYCPYHIGEVYDISHSLTNLEK